MFLRQEVKILSAGTHKVSAGFEQNKLKYGALAVIRNPTSCGHLDTDEIKPQGWLRRGGKKAKLQRIWS